MVFGVVKAIDGVPIIFGHLMQMFVWHVRVIQGLLSETRINHGLSLGQTTEALLIWKKKLGEIVEIQARYIVTAGPACYN